MIASPLTSLLKGKPSKLKWTEEASQAYNTLKAKFTTASILTQFSICGRGRRLRLRKSGLCSPNTMANLGNCIHAHSSQES